MQQVEPVESERHGGRVSLVGGGRGRRRRGATWLRVSFGRRRRWTGCQLEVRLLRLLSRRRVAATAAAVLLYLGRHPPLCGDHTYSEFVNN